MVEYIEPRERNKSWWSIAYSVGIKIATFVFFFVLTVFVILGAYVMWGQYKLSTNIPYDDLGTHVTNMTCHENFCEVEFDRNVSTYFQAASTGSMVPLIGGKDWVVCLDANNETLELGEIIITPFALHMIYDIDGDWYITKGWNNPDVDPYKVAKDKVRCVVGLVGR